MTIIVKHIKTGNEYILIGTGLGTKSLDLSFLRGKLLPEKSQEDIHLVALCDQEGTIFWLASSEVVVSEINNQKPSDLLAGRTTIPATMLLNNKEENKEDIIDEEDEDWV